MSAAYIDAVTTRAPQAKIVFDRFPRTAARPQTALDDLRRAEVRRLEDTGERGVLKKTRWALLKNPWNLTALERERLAKLQRTNRRLYRGYLLKEALADILGRRQVQVVPRQAPGVGGISWGDALSARAVQKGRGDNQEALRGRPRHRRHRSQQRPHRGPQWQDQGNHPQGLRLPQRFPPSSASSSSAAQAWSCTPVFKSPDLLP